MQTVILPQAEVFMPDIPAEVLPDLLQRFNYCN
jgi:hypothetical protein